MPAHQEYQTPNSHSNNFFDLGGLSDIQRRSFKKIEKYCKRYKRAYPGQKKLASELKVCVRTVQRAIKALVALGYIEVTRTNRDRWFHRNNTYKLTTAYLIFSRPAPRFFRATTQKPPSQNVASKKLKTKTTPSTNSYTKFHKTKCQNRGIFPFRGYVSYAMAEILDVLGESHAPLAAKGRNELGDDELHQVYRDVTDEERARRDSDSPIKNVKGYLIQSLKNRIKERHPKRPQNPVKHCQRTPN